MPANPHELFRLEAARFLKLRGEQIRFVIPKGKLGEDYDLEILRETGAICCEVKIRLEAEELTEEWAYRRLGDAREQLPKSKPGLIILRIAGTLTNDDLQAKTRIIDRAMRRLFGQTKRIIGLVLLTRGYQFSEDDMAMWSLWKTMINRNSNYPASLVENLREMHVEKPSKDWTYLMQYRPRFVFDWA